MQRVQALEGMRVLDLTTSGAGPFVTQYLADHGATVIKIESRRYIDMARQMMAFVGGNPGEDRPPSLGPVVSKYSLALDMGHPRARQIARNLAAWSDVFVESFAPGVVERWGLGYEDVRRIKPDIVMLRTSLQGQTGPYSTHPGWGFTAKGLTGFVHLTGWPDRDGVGTAQPITDFTAPVMGVVAILAALAHRRKTGFGQCIDLSQFEATLPFIAPALLAYTANGEIQMRQGNRSASTAPHGVYRCKGDDRWCSIAVETEDQWRSLCEVAGHAKWTKLPRFATLLGRLKNVDELDELINGWTANWSPEELMAALQSKGVPAGVVQDAEDLLDRDQHLQYRRHFDPVGYPEGGTLRHHAWPARFSRTPAKPRPGARLGEHTASICKEVIGMSDEEFVELLNAGVFE